MRILFVCKASTEIGLGHLIRSRTLAAGLNRLGALVIDFVLIGDASLISLVNGYVQNKITLASENELALQNSYDLAFVDMLEMKAETMFAIRQRAPRVASLSPIFNRMAEVDLLFSRTRYQPVAEPGPGQVYAGPDYAIIQGDCGKIGAGEYEKTLESGTFPIAICMGGGDAPNKTLKILRTLKHCAVDATFWVMLGEGYCHSYDELIAEIKNNKRHEIILARTNKSMWQVLRNCAVGIFSGGVTSYEAAFAGLPAVNLIDQSEKYFLIRELVENDACWCLGQSFEESLGSLNKHLEQVHANHNTLMKMHIDSKQLISGNASENIFSACSDLLSSRVGAWGSRAIQECA
ncbi:Spore coat polysaccharide biosynthesis protein SpsG, predicted glycosyltransferase [Malonomonas rubra DSM 5091]|uniref:Spore coat polysaccharide biosynthesis protein SpsG, predicted glycosyltransferase n=1 Tax=Malonomonas rubra DSM 5091 TaxID=1122189 RepID=A0A1M6MAD4_MALRU|nr:hypothetical protein [Malonomonas rubra]SHJ80320.1 Spore coat polysaccharide biosynthesis protein SpsG, predicted glycosyltransferase [Malonomonas rubra DSM 5091]